MRTNGANQTIECYSCYSLTLAASYGEEFQQVNHCLCSHDTPHGSAAVACWLEDLLCHLFAEVAVMDHAVGWCLAICSYSLQATTHRLHCEPSGVGWQAC